MRVESAEAGHYGNRDGVGDRRDSKARKVAGRRTTVVGVRCESRESFPSVDLPNDADLVLRGIDEADWFLCEVRGVTGQTEFTKHLCGLNGVRREGSIEERPTLFEVECPEDS